MRDTEDKIAAAVAEARRISDLDTLAAWLVANLPGPFAQIHQVNAGRPLSIGSRVTFARFYSPVYLREISHMQGRCHQGLPLAPPGERTRISGCRVTLEMRTEGGNWWNSIILQRLGIYPAQYGSGFGRSVSDVILRGDDWTPLVVMLRLKGD